MIDITISTASYLLPYIIGLLIALSFGILYSKQKLKYFKNHGIRGPKPVPLFGNILELGVIPMTATFMKYAKRYGRVYGFYRGHERVLRIAEPDLIKQILVKDFHKFTDRFDFRSNEPTWDLMLFASQGDAWKRLRALSSSTFSSGKMKKMYSMVQECTDLLVNAIDKAATRKGEIDLKMTFGNLTMDVICSCAFATKTNTHEDSNNIHSYKGF